MESTLFVIALGLLLVLILLLVLLLIAQLRAQSLNSSSRTHRTTQPRATKPQQRALPQSETTLPASAPTAPVTTFNSGTPESDGLTPIQPHRLGPVQSLVPDRTRFAAQGQIIQPNAPMREIPAAFTEIIAQRTSNHAYAKHSKSGAPKFDAGTLPQVPGYRVASTGAPFGTVMLYQAFSLEDETAVALKVVNPVSLAGAQSFRQKFDQQLAIGHTIRHPNCAAVLGGNTNTSTPYVIEEWLPGGSLREVMTPGQPMSAKDITLIVGQVCNALAYLHKRSIIHQAVSPSHLRFDEQGNLHLIHCAFARLLTEVKRTPMGVVMGDVAYLSAEHLGGYTMTPRSDLYSLGVLAFEIATGQTPFKGSDVEVIRQHLDTPPPDPQKINPALSKDMALAILKALEKDPAKRFQNARDMARAFGFSEVFDGFKEATNLLYVSPTTRTPSPYVNENVANPYDFSLARRSVAPQATEVLKMRNMFTGIVVAVNTPHAIVTRDLINPQDAMISRTNGQIYLQDGHWWISELPDAPSQNGLYVNESRITEPRPIHLGDRLRVGKTTLLVVS
jgi:serine/threonine protein kinase